MKRLLWTGVLALLAFPCLYVGVRAFSPPGGEGLLSLGLPFLATLVKNTLALVLCGGFLALALGAGAAVLTARCDFPGRRFLEAALCLPFALPPYLVAGIYNETAHRHYQLGIGVENLPGASLLFAVVLYPYVYLPLRVTLENQASVYAETGQALGMGPWKRFAKILLPLAAPALCAGFLLVAMEILSDYGAVSLLGIRTLTTGVYDIWFIMGKPQAAARAALVLVLLSLGIFALLGRYTRLKRFHNPSNRPARIQRKKLSPRASAGAILSLCLPLFFGFAFPVAVLIAWTVKTLPRARLGSLYGDIGQTVLLAACVTLLCLSTAYALALLRRGARSSPWLSRATFMVNANYAIPAIVTAIAFLFLTGDLSGTVLSGLVSGSIFFLVCACATRYLCFAHLSVESGMAGIPAGLDETMRTLNKGRLFSLRKIHLPMLRPFLVIGGILVFVNIAKELTMTLVLQPFDYNSLATRTWSFARVGAMQESAVYALCLVLVSVYPVFSMGRWLGRRS